MSWICAWLCDVLRASKFSVLELIEIVILWVYYTIPFGFSLYRLFGGITFQFFKLLYLAKDYWRGFSTRKAHMVHIVLLPSPSSRPSSPLPPLLPPPAPHIPSGPLISHLPLTLSALSDTWMLEPHFSQHTRKQFLNVISFLYEYVTRRGN